MRKTSKQVLEEYCKEMERPYPEGIWADFMLHMVVRCREDEPRINCGVHLIDYMNICDEDDDMDSFYGPDYPW